uniref:Uncharacterized protein TCIL3000_7_2250 n=1 Tax=Trypanosoma congolense (strain IL3000) TaxID=1068625 RepID=G0UPV4_TRYCI|nr:unnamed protein product [Trypanosoma congolense IL3000]
MELEGQREQLIEAHQAMTEERKRAARERRRDLLREAAELRAQGKNSVEVLTAMKERQLDANARRQAEYELKEQEDILKRKSELLDLIARFKYDVENREGRELLQRQGASSGTAPNVFGFYEGEEAGEVVSSGTEKSSQLSTGETSSTGRALAEGYDKTSETQPSLQQQRSEIWKSINSDTYEDPFRTVHQARLDAVKTYDSTYARTFPLNLVLGRKYSRQGAGEMAAGNEMDRQILQKGNSVAYSFQWGIGSKTVHDLDADGSMDYFMDGSFHVRDKETGDIDWRYEKKSGGAIFRGPKFYRLGAQREAAEAGERTMDPVPRDPNPQRSWRSS